MDADVQERENAARDLFATENVCANGHLDLASLKVDVAKSLQNAVAAFADGANVNNGVCTSSKMLIEVSCNDSNSGNNEWFIDLIK